MTDYTQITLPPGRFVFGDCFVTETKTNKETGETYQIWRMTIAYPFADQAFAATHAQLKSIAQAAFPQGEFNQPNFSLKVKSADEPGIQKGVIPSVKYPHLAGHWLVEVETKTKPPEVFEKDAVGADVQVSLAQHSIKRGDFVSVGIAAAGNGQHANVPGSGVPGLKLYLNGVLLVQQGDALGGGGPIDPTQMFAGINAVAPTSLPGATPAPAPAPATAAALPGATPAPAPAAALPGPAPTTALPGAAPAPAPAAALPGATPAPAPAPVAALPGATPAPAPAPAAAKVMTATATTTYEAYITAGHTDETLIAQGLMVAPNPAFLPQ